MATTELATSLAYSDLLGSIPVTPSSTTSRMVPGDVIYLAPGEWHALVADAPSHLSLVMVDVAATAASGASPTA